MGIMRYKLEARDTSEDITLRWMNLLQAFNMMFSHSKVKNTYHMNLRQLSSSTIEANDGNPDVASLTLVGLYTTTDA
jgi:hypothetical protein